MAKTGRRTTGDLGEDLAAKFLLRRGFELVERNYLRKWGEIDIVAQKSGLIRLVEVKSVVSRGTRADSVPQETVFRPEENLHPGKLRRLARTVQLYMVEKKLDLDWQLDLVTVRINEGTRTARVELVENIVV